MAVSITIHPDADARLRMLKDAWKSGQIGKDSSHKRGPEQSRNQRQEVEPQSASE